MGDSFGNAGGRDSPFGNIAGRDLRPSSYAGPQNTVGLPALLNTSLTDSKIPKMGATKKSSVTQPHRLEDNGLLSTIEKAAHSDEESSPPQLPFKEDQVFCLSQVEILNYTNLCFFFLTAITVKNENTVFVYHYKEKTWTCNFHDIFIVLTTVWGIFKLIILFDFIRPLRWGNIPDRQSQCRVLWQWPEFRRYHHPLLRLDLQVLWVVSRFQFYIYLHLAKVGRRFIGYSYTHLIAILITYERVLKQPGCNVTQL